MSSPKQLIKSQKEIPQPRGSTKTAFDKSCKIVDEVCMSLCVQSDSYDPQSTIEILKAYPASNGRIIYSVLTNSVYHLSEEDRGNTTTNLDRLLEYTMESHSPVPESIQSLVIRLWDHFHLAFQQVEQTTQIHAKNIQETKKALYNKLYREFNGMQREYITILGIFASIIVSFVAGLTFSTSVLQNMSDVSIYRLVLVILLLGFVLLNAINLLIHYIFSLNKATELKFPIWQLNTAIGVMLVLTVVCWGLNFHKLPAFLQSYFIWSAN